MLWILSYARNANKKGRGQSHWAMTAAFVFQTSG